VETEVPASLRRLMSRPHVAPNTALPFRTHGAAPTGRPTNRHLPRTDAMSFPTPNADESLVSAPPLQDAPFIGNFHKTLPHNDFGEVDPAAYRIFERTCQQVEAGMPVNFEAVPPGPLVQAAQSAFQVMPAAVAPLVSPLAGASSEAHGPDPKSMEMPPAPGCRSLSATAEMVELYWMALLRDAPLLAFQRQRGNPGAGCAGLFALDAELGYDLQARLTDARQHVNTVFDCAVRHDADAGRLRTTLDLDAGPGGADVARQTLFRSGLHDEEHGPLVSQFFLRRVGYGTQTIDPEQVPYAARRDYLITHGDWLLAQNTGMDRYGRGYGQCNQYGDQLDHGVLYYPTTDGTPGGTPVRRCIATMRDLARFVNRDALHQAYFNAALFLDGLGARVDAGNPYRGHRFTRETAFATLGGPDLLTLVSEVASRALKVVWRQKWLVHRRCRPEVFGGLLQMQLNGHGGELRDYGLTLASDLCPNFGAAVTATLAEVQAHNAALNGGTPTLFLPMAFSAGSPSHPAYGAGHATVAGACVTVLKAWFDEDQTLTELLAGAGRKDPPVPGEPLQILQPGFRRTGADLEAFCEPMPYAGDDAALMTVGGELNKLASNVAMGRSMGGVHWRSDNTRSLRLGEDIAIEILRKRSAEYAERPVSFTFRSFDRQTVHITQGQVQRS
jgi:hypothetical protein